VRVDRDHGVRFDLEGSVLTVGLVGQTETSNELWGKRIRAVCSPTFGYRETLRVAVRGVQLWPTGQTELTYNFDRDISDRGQVVPARGGQRRRYRGCPVPGVHRRPRRQREGQADRAGAAQLPLAQRRRGAVAEATEGHRRRPWRDNGCDAASRSTARQADRT
jgi:hypothetical protein